MLDFLNTKTGEIGDLSVINLISKGTIISGNLTTQGNIRIDGQLIGNLTTPYKLVTGAHSELKGDLKIGSGRIAGVVKGNIYSSGVLEIEKTAVIEGNIESKGLIVQEGATLFAEISTKGNILQLPSDKLSKNKISDFSRAAVL